MITKHIAVTHDCPCGGKGTVQVLTEESDTYKGVFEHNPLYYKYCSICNMQYVDDEVMGLNRALFDTIPPGVSGGVD